MKLEPIYILIGIVLFILVVWLVSEIQIKVWIHRVEKHLNKDYKKLKNSKEDGKSK